MHRGVEQSRAVEFAEDRHNPSRTVYVFDVVVGIRRDLADDRHPARERVDVFHREFHARLLRYGQQVQNRVRRTAHRDVHRHGVQECFPRGDRTGQYGVVIVEIVFVRVFDDQFGRFAEQVGTSRMRGEDRSVAGQRKAERFGQAVHRIGREHS